MEPITWILLGGALVFGGFQIFTKDDPEQHTARTVMVIESTNTDQAFQTTATINTQTEAVNGFERGVYLGTEEGYVISNLSAPKTTIIGCDQPILVTDLTSRESVNEIIRVTEVNVTCTEKAN